MSRRVILSLVLAAGLAASCVPTVLEGSGNLATESREVGGIRAVTLAGVGNLVVRQTGAEALTVTADDNLVEYIRTEVRGGTLIIELDPRAPGTIVKPSVTPVFDLQIAVIEGIAASGSGSVAADTLRAETISIAVSGSGDVRMASLDVDGIEAAISGSGDVVLAGRARAQTIAVSGSGRYSASELASSSAAVGVSGSGDARVWAADALDISISGSGSVAYYGDPDVTKRVSGSGRVLALGPKSITL
jgi:hypothetical protein